MKSQDLLVLLRIVSLELAEARLRGGVQDAERAAAKLLFDWEGWESESSEAMYFPASDLGEVALAEHYSARALAEAVGISKTEVSASLRRSMDAGLARRDRHSGLPRANRSALLELGEHCLRWVFPVRPGPLERGIATGFAAPVLADQVLSAGDNPYVWPDARGKATGQSITPLYKSAAQAVRGDPDLYAMLALLDALRLGQPRERAIARDKLAVMLELS
jgi:DNA-binding MarR family transcriptional regulator